MQKSVIHECGRDLRICGDFDVVVVGAGIAGCAAALAAARVKGTRVCLVENFCLPGGLATIGNVIVYLPLCDGMGHQVCGGLSEKFLRLSVEKETYDCWDKGIVRVPECWNKGGNEEERKEKRYRAEFNPMYLALALESQLRAKRVKLLYAARFADVIKEGRNIKAVVLETKDGRIALTCRAVVDASGDADVCIAAGEQTVKYPRNVRCSWFYVQEKGDMRLYRETDAGYLRDPEHKFKRIYQFDAMNGIPNQIIASHDKVRERLAAIEAADGTAPFIANIPTFPTFRMTRRLVGKVTMRAGDDHRWFNDTVGMTGDWRKRGPIFCVPLRAQTAVETDNLIAAGRCISSAGDNWDVTRVIPTCAVTGESAGAAAAMLAADGTISSFEELPVTALQKHLKDNKVIIDRTILDK